MRGSVFYINMVFIAQRFVAGIRMYKEVQKGGTGIALY